MNPYVAGVLLGLVLLAAFYLTGRGLGASGAVKSAVVATVTSVAPGHAEAAPFYHHPEGHPLHAWLVLQVLGVVVGGFLSGAYANRLTWKIEHSPEISSGKRLVLALAGGALFGFGAQFGRGCTSGAALSGMATLSLAGFVTMVAIFGTAFAFAYLFRKNWI